MIYLYISNVCTVKFDSVKTEEEKTVIDIRNIPISLKFCFKFAMALLLFL